MWTPAWFILNPPKVFSFLFFSFCTLGSENKSERISSLVKLMFSGKWHFYLFMSPTRWRVSPPSLSSAVDSRSGAKVAIKKLYRPFQSELFAKRAYRELRLLKHMKHENVRRVHEDKVRHLAALMPLWPASTRVTYFSVWQVIGLLDVFTADLSLDAFHDL